jgi:protein transport protein SEC61 subunit gamma and related proteins
MNISGMITQFINDSKRVLIVSKKPTMDEYKKMIIIVALGMAVIGVMGYLIMLFFAVTGIGA